MKQLPLAGKPVCRVGAVVLVACITPLCSAMADDADQINTGQDVTDPVQRIDLRLNYSDLPGGFDSRTFILRYDRPVDLGDGWKLGLRFDAPFAYNNVPSADNFDGDYEYGYGDTLFQALLIRPLDARSAVGFGAQLIAPSGTQDQFSSGKWQVVPTLGYRYALPEISPGSFFVAAARYATDFAGDDHRDDISNLQFSPTLNIALPEQSFLTFYPSTDIRYNFVSDSWFVPLDVQIGKLWGGNIVTSLEAAVPLYKGDTPLYDFKIEARLGIFF